MGAPERVTDHDVTEALAALPDSTAAEIAGALGIGRSTAAKRLARLEGQGAVQRSPGGRIDGTKVADRWSLATPPTAYDHDAGTAAPLRSGSDPGEEADPQTGFKDVGQPDDAQPVTDHPAPGTGAGGTGTRLSPGSLRALVRDYLAGHPGQSFGPSGIARSLGRSAGAVSNALAAMTEAGEVRLVADRPRRYRIAGRE